MRVHVIRVLEGTAADFERWSTRFALAFFYGLPPAVILLGLLVAGRALGVTHDDSPGTIGTIAMTLLGSFVLMTLACLGTAYGLRRLCRLV